VLHSHRPYDFVGLTASSRQHGNVRLSKGAFKDAENLWTFGFDKCQNRAHSTRTTEESNTRIQLWRGARQTGVSKLDSEATPRLGRPLPRSGSQWDKCQ